MPLDLWLTFVAASTALLLIPGPTILLVLTYALTQGRRVAVATAAGVARGDQLPQADHDRGGHEARLHVPAARRSSAPHGREVPGHQLPAVPRSARRRARRSPLRDRFLRDVRERVKELSGRGYAASDTTVGFLLLFIPNESVYGFIHEHDHVSARRCAAAAGRAVFADHAVRGPGRDPSGDGHLCRGAGHGGDPRVPRRVRRAVAEVLGPHRQGRTSHGDPAQQLRGAVGAPPPHARASAQQDRGCPGPGHRRADRHRVRVATARGDAPRPVLRDLNAS